MLRNAAYIGEWSYKKLEWRKVPGTNIRRPRPRPTSEVITQTFPERRIIDEETWEAVRARAAAVAAKYRGKSDKQDAAPGARTSYPSRACSSAPCAAHPS